MQLNINKYKKFIFYTKKFGILKTLKICYNYIKSILLSQKKLNTLKPIYELPKKYYFNNNNLKLICFYLPQFHTFKENDLWWGKGFTEWTNVKRSKPMFTNHIQPEIPNSDIGYYIMNNTSTIKKQIILAKSFGIYGFCFHYYWFSGKRIMEKIVDEYISDKSIDFPFCLNWANENWTRRWHGKDNEILIKQDYTMENIINFMTQLIPIFNDKRYIRINDRPILLIYAPEQIPNLINVLKIWKKICIQKGEKEPFFVMCLTRENYNFLDFGFDYAVQFPPHQPWLIHEQNRLELQYYKVEGLNKNFRGRIYAYDDIANSCIMSQNNMIFPCVFPSRDNTPRRLENSYIFVGASPKKYENWLANACEFSSKQKHKFVFINAWNEWGEGAHLEPDSAWGYAWLNATGNVLSTYNT